MTQPETLRAALRGAPAAAALFGAHRQVPLAALADGHVLDRDLTGRSVLIRTRDPLAAALALIELDGRARRMVIAPPDLDETHLPTIRTRAEIDAIVSDEDWPGHDVERIGALHARAGAPASHKSEWVMFTSGTSGVPKMVAHSFASLTGAIAPGATPAITWGTYYDIRRYGGLQILLRALLGHTSLVLSDSAEPVADFLARAGARAVTHLTGTPSHWRRALMSPALEKIAPRYVRLSGEIADQAILDSLKAAFPAAAIGHAYASTEAGVGFEVTDGLEGFPASLIGAPGAVEMRLVESSLQLRSARTAARYVGSADRLAADGFVDTGDIIEQRGARCYFMGRKGGIINVGGLKIHPEEVEAVLNRHPAVRAARVSGRKNPITGAIVVAEVVLKDGIAGDAALKNTILETCRAHLAPAKVPAGLRFIDALALTAGGKLARHD
jgi:acyl-coenzyme A synthetase/AMP-(fatty) acid ligase